MVDFTSQEALYTSTLQTGISNSLAAHHVELEDIVYVSISHPDGHHGRRLQGSTVKLSYSVKVWSSTETFETLTDAVRDAVHDTTMQTAINDAANISGAEALQLATVVDSVEFQDRTISRGHSVLLTGTQIAGLIIGIFLCLALIAVVVLFALHTKKAAPASNTNAPLEMELA